MFRNNLVFASKLMSEQEFADLNFKFQTKEEQTMEAINLEFTKDDFSEVTGPSATALFKIAAFSEIESATSSDAKKDLSIKH